MNRSLSFVLVAILAAACAPAGEDSSTDSSKKSESSKKGSAKNDTAKGESETDPVVDETPVADDAEYFGAALTGAYEVATVEQVFANPDVYKSKAIRLAGIVRTVCQQRGCWMEVRPEEDREGVSVRVTFKGYAFFMPKDSRGANVTLEGSVKVVTLTPEEVTHYEAEGATFDKKNADGSVTSVNVIANGVEMRNHPH